MRVHVVQMANGTLTIIHPALADGTRPQRPVRDEDGKIVFRTETRTRKVYDFATKQVVDETFDIQVPQMEYIHSDDDWADRCAALTIAKNPALQGRPVVVMDSSQLPPRTQRNAWRLQNGRVVIQP